MRVSDIGFDTDERLERASVESAESFPALRYALSPLFDVRRTSASGVLDGSIVAYRVDGVVVGRLRFGGLWIGRNCHGYAASTATAVAVQSYRAGSFRGHSGVEELALTGSCVAVLDTTAAFHGVAEFEILLAVIPQRRLQGVRIGSGGFSSCVWDEESTEAAMMTPLLESIWTQLSHTNESDGPKLASAFTGMLGGLVASERRQAASISAHTLDEMKKYLRRNLDDPDLGAHSLEREFHRSRATIYRIFTDDGGVASFIRTERLRRCHAQLTSGDVDGTTLATIASSSGLDPTHFSRMFRNQYGCAPSELHRAAQAARLDRPESNGYRPVGDAVRIHQWLSAM